jgi:Ca2+-dependent lipid-binding protein
LSYDPDRETYFRNVHQGLGLDRQDGTFLPIKDPYCIISVGGQQQKTQVCKGGGKKPNWTDTFTFNSLDPILRLQVYDHDTIGKDDFIGEGTIDLNQIYKNPMRT